RRFSQQYPRIQVHTDLIDRTEAFLALRERRCDCVLLSMPIGLLDKAADDLTVEILYDDAVNVAASAHSKWVRCRKIDLAELIDEPWILTGPTAWNRTASEEIFAAAGLSHPNPRIVSNSIILRARLIAGSPYLGMFLTSTLRRLIADNYALAALPVDLHANAYSIAAITLKNRTLSPVVERFLVCVREVAASLNGKRGHGAARRSKSKVS